MLGVPATTAYDLRFRLLGIPVRVHPLFWIVTVVLGGVGANPPSFVAIWVGCVFVSILVHEFGHGLMTRLFGYHPAVILYGMGGLCVSDAARQSPGQRLAILISGPGAGFLLAACVFAIALIAPPQTGTTAEIVNILLWINVVWGLLNLLPIYPLDGGQMTGVVLSRLNRRSGTRWTHVISLLVAGLLAVANYTYTKDLYRTLFFAYFGIINYQMLQSLHYESQYGTEDNADWWKR
jgi:Zn-dependent protease